MTMKVLVTGSSVRAKSLEPLTRKGWIVENPTHLLSEDELRVALLEADAYLLGGDEYATRAVLAAAPKLKIIAFLGMGYEKYIDYRAASEFGVAVTNTPGTLSQALAELTLGHLINGVRSIHYYATLFEKGSDEAAKKCRNVAAMHHGIIGLGGTGLRLAEILGPGLGSKVSYYSRTRKPDAEQALGIGYLPFEELIGAVDSLVLLTPIDERTTGLIGHREIGLAKQGVVVVNTASPNVVDPAALNAGLENGKVGYACFDHFYEHSDDAVESLRRKAPEKLMVTPHIGSLTDDARDAMAKSAVDSIVHMLTTGQAPNRVI